MTHGRKKGEMVGRGIVQTFIKEHGGLPWLIELYNELGSMDKVEMHLLQKYAFYCSGNALRNFAVQRGVSFAVNHGGYRRGVRKTEPVKIEVPA